MRVYECVESDTNGDADGGGVERRQEREGYVV